MSITKGFANIKYRFPERLVEDLTIVRGEPPLEPLPLKTYWSLFDQLFPRYTNAYPDPHSCDTDFFLETVLTVQLAPRQIELFYLPWLLQKTDLNDEPTHDTIDENVIITTSTKRVNHLQWGMGSFWIFYGCVALNILMNIIVFIWVYTTIPVELASLADVDFPNSYFNMKRPGEHTSLEKAYRDLANLSTANLSTRELVARLYNIRLRFIPKKTDGALMGEEEEFNWRAIREGREVGRER
jgi:hypothetical protein